MDTSIQRLLKIKKVIFWINAHIPIEKQSNQDWNTPIHLKNNSTHIRIPLIFCFLSWLSTYVFITNCELNTYAYILEIVLHILDKIIHDSQNVCGHLTMNEMHIKLTSLITFSINYNLTNTSLTPPSEVKKEVLYIVHFRG